MPMRAGELLIFNGLVAHGIRPNTPEGAQGFGGVRVSRGPREWEGTRYETAVLSPLGRRLLGVDDWD